jgi:hypothetical protein
MGGYQYQGPSEEDRGERLYSGYKKQPALYSSVDKLPVIHDATKKGETRGLRKCSLDGTLLKKGKMSRVACAYDRGITHENAKPILVMAYNEKDWVYWGRADNWGLFTHLTHVKTAIDNELKNAFYDTI